MVNESRKIGLHPIPSVTGSVYGPNANTPPPPAEPKPEKPPKVVDPNWAKDMVKTSPRYKDQYSRFREDLAESIDNQWNHWTGPGLITEAKKTGNFPVRGAAFRDAYSVDKHGNPDEKAFMSQFNEDFFPFGTAEKFKGRVIPRDLPSERIFLPDSYGKKAPKPYYGPRMDGSSKDPNKVFGYPDPQGLHEAQSEKFYGARHHDPKPYGVGMPPDPRPGAAYRDMNSNTGSIEAGLAPFEVRTLKGGGELRLPNPFGKVFGRGYGRGSHYKPSAGSGYVPSGAAKSKTPWRDPWRLPSGKYERDAWGRPL